MKKEFSEVLVSFLGLLLIFSLPNQFSLYNISFFSLMILCSFVFRIFFQKYIARDEIMFKTDKRMMVASIAISFVTLGFIKWAAVGGFKKSNKRIAGFGIMFNLILGLVFLFASMILQTTALVSEFVFSLTLFFVMLSYSNLVFAFSNIIPVGDLDGNILFRKDKKTFWALLCFSISLFGLFFLWYRFSVLFRVFN